MNLRKIWNDVISSPGFAYYWRGFSAALLIFYAGNAYWHGLRGNTFTFDWNALIAGMYAFAMAKSHSQVKRMHRRLPGD